MKATLLSAAALAGLALMFGPAMAADSTAYMNQCRAGAANIPASSQFKPQDMIDFCQCMVDEVGDDQATLDEMTAMSERMSRMTPEQRQAEGPPSNKKITAAFESCRPEGFGPPAQAK